MLEAPEDLPRLALWSDWLLERGDPRGELVSLQLAQRALAPKEQKRVGTLVRKHGRDWIGKLSGVADPKELKFERWLLVGMRAMPVSDARIAAGAPHWRALESLEVPAYGISPKLEGCILDCLPRLSSLDGLSLKTGLFRRVLEARAPRVTRLGLDLDFHAEAISAPHLELLAGAKFPALRALRVGGQPGPKVLRQLLAPPWFKAIEHLCVDGGQPAQRLEVLHATALKRIEVWPPHDDR